MRALVLALSITGISAYNTCEYEYDFRGWQSGSETVRVNLFKLPYANCLMNNGDQCNIGDYLYESGGILICTSRPSCSMVNIADNGRPDEECWIGDENTYTSGSKPYVYYGGVHSLPKCIFAGAGYSQMSETCIFNTNLNQCHTSRYLYVDTRLNSKPVRCHSKPPCNMVNIADNGTPDVDCFIGSFSTFTDDDYDRYVYDGGVHSQPCSGGCSQSIETMPDKTSCFYFSTDAWWYTGEGCKRGHGDNDLRDYGRRIVHQCL